MKRLSLVLSTVLLALLAISTTASAHSGGVTATQDCKTWSVEVHLDNNTTPERTVDVLTTIPGTTGITGGHYDTDMGQIWSASGAAIAQGTVTLNIYTGDTLEYTASASLPTPADCKAFNDPSARFQGPCGDPLYRAILDNRLSGVPSTFRIHFLSFGKDAWVTQVRTVAAHTLFKTTWKHVVGSSVMTIRGPSGRILAQKTSAAPGFYGSCGRWT